MRGMEMRPTSSLNYRLKRILHLTEGETTSFILDPDATRFDRSNAVTAAYRTLGRVAGKVELRGNRLIVTRWKKRGTE